jgi:hypothetical protein
MDVSIDLDEVEFMNVDRQVRKFSEGTLTMPSNKGTLEFLARKEESLDRLIRELTLLREELRFRND